MHLSACAPPYCPNSESFSYGEINKLIAQLKDAENPRAIDLENNNIQKIHDFYNQFKEAYSSKDVSSVTSLLADDWSSSGDGTSIGDFYVAKNIR